MEYIKLGDICEIKSSKRIYQSDYVDNGVPFYRGKEISELSRNEDIETELYITEEKYKELNEKFGSVQKGDLLITSVGTIGNTWVSDGRKLYYKDGNITQIVNNDKINTKYISYLFKSNLIKRQYLKGTSGTAQVALTIEKLKNITIPKLSIDEQNKIVEVLDKAQSLIDKKREQIELLDELVKSRFIEMFGDPVNNPKSFEILTIGDLTTDVKYGTSKSSSDGGKYPYLRMNNITYDGKLDLNDLKYIDIDDNELEKYIVKKGDVLFNRTNSIELIGKTCVFELDEPMIIAGYIIRVRLKNNILPIYLSTFLNSSYGKTLLRGMAKGAVNQANINAQELKSIKVHVPPIELQNEFAEFVTKIDSIRSKMEASLSELEDNFNSLMQKAFKGELF